MGPSKEIGNASGVRPGGEDLRSAGAFDQVSLGPMQKHAKRDEQNERINATTFFDGGKPIVFTLPDESTDEDDQIEVLKDILHQLGDDDESDCIQVVN